METEKLRGFIEEQLSGSGCYLVDMQVSPAKEIMVEIDSATPVDIDRCVSLTRAIEEAFPETVEDYDLEVGSAGLTSPLKLPAQYRKHIGHDMEILTRDGRKIHGCITAADDEGFTAEWTRKVKREGEKRPVEETVFERFLYPDVKKVVYDLKF